MIRLNSSSFRCFSVGIKHLASSVSIGFKFESATISFCVSRCCTKSPSIVSTVIDSFSNASRSSLTCVSLPIGSTVPENLFAPFNVSSKCSSNCPFFAAFNLFNTIATSAFVKHSKSVSGNVSFSTLRRNRKKKDRRVRVCVFVCESGCHTIKKNDLI